MTIRNSAECFVNGVAVKSLAILGLATMFTACGDDTLDNISSRTQDGIQIVSEEGDLPDCKKDNDGELMFIRSEVSLRICSDKKWRAVTQDRDGKMNFTCSTKPLADSSGLKIICGGDSIGVVLNGINGTNGKNGESVRGTNGKNGENGTSCTAVSLADSTGMKIICGQDSMGVVYNGFNGTNGSNGESCTAEVLDDLSGMKIVCGKDSVGVVYNGKNGINGENGTSCELMELDEISLRIDCGEMSATIQLNDAFKIMAITNKTITGVAQFKKPSFIGSSVFLYELDGTTLATTGRVFKGKVTGDNGEYSIPNVSLVSQYALLGESTGENALVDLSNRTVVNINVMTSLEIDRVRYLVKEGMSFAVAKKQAESEILNAFGITDELNEPEEMNILGLEKGDSVLYAISNLVGSFMNEIEIDFEKNGKLDDEKRKVEIADDIVWKSDNLVKYLYIN